MFDCRFEVEGELKYSRDATDLYRPERSTLTVSYHDVQEYSTRLAETIQEYYYK